jgi:hypothetical protein
MSSMAIFRQQTDCFKPTNRTFCRDSGYQSLSLPFRGEESFICRGQVDISTRGDL